MKKILSVCALLCCAVFLYGAAAAAEKEIRIALWKLPLNVPAMAALEEGAYDKTFAGDRKITYVQLPSGPKQIQAMAANALDISEGIGAPAVLVGAAGGAGIRIVGVTSRSPKAFAVMKVDPQIKSVTDLKGKRVAGLRGSVVHELFLICLAEAGMSEKDVEFFPMTLHAAASALIGGRVDAALLVGTEIVKARNAGAQVLADGEGRVRGLSLVIVRTKFLEENADAVRKYLHTRRQIAARMKDDPDIFLPIVMRETGLSESEAKELIKHYDFDDLFTDKDKESLLNTYRYLENGKYIRGKVDFEQLLRPLDSD